MMKKTIIILAILLFVGIAGAYSIGQVIDQQTVNNQDFSTHDMDFEIQSIGIINKFIVLKVDYTTLKPLTDVNGIATGEYEIVRKTRNSNYLLKSYYDCRFSGRTKSSCLQSVKSYLVYQVKSFRRFERFRLDSYKTNFENEIIANDLNLTVQDFS